MTKCERCGTKLKTSDTIEGIYEGKLFCKKCYIEVKQKNNQLSPEKEEERKKRIEKIVELAPKIKCPYCEQWFPKLTNEEYKDSAELNVLKWAIIPAWGVVGALKNKPFIRCPHCGMKIMQG